MLDIHDADLVLPGVARRVREYNAQTLKMINLNGFKIVKNYLESIGGLTKKGKTDYIKLKNSCKQADPLTEFSRLCMK